MKRNVNRAVSPSAKDRKLAVISRRYHLSAFYAFGSRATETAGFVRSKSGAMKKSDADLDIAVLPDFGVGLSAREKVEIALELEEFFSVSRVDLVILPEADPFLAVNAIRGERIYCTDEHRADEYELYLLRRAGDLIPMERERIRIIMEEGK